MDVKFERNSFSRRLKSMLAVDFRRMFTTRFIYIMAGICFVMPILILVMTTMFSGESLESTEAAMDMFTNTWQIIGTSSDFSQVSMDMAAMCNINMLYFFLAVLVCVFVSDDFKSGYAKNLFTVRAKKGDYVISKILVCFAGGVLLLLAFFIGTVLGGAISGLSFDAGAAGFGGVILCMMTKILVTLVFVPIYLAMSVAAKQKTWLSMILSFMVGMLLFMMIPALTPLDATMMNVILCLLGGVLFSVGLGTVSRIILAKTSLV